MLQTKMFIVAGLVDAVADDRHCLRAVLQRYANPFTHGLTP